MRQIIVCYLYGLTTVDIYILIHFFSLKFFLKKIYPQVHILRACVCSVHFLFVLETDLTFEYKYSRKSFATSHNHYIIIVVVIILILSYVVAVQSEHA